MYPYVSLRQLTIDPELARRLPRRLAYYHLAIPIAQENDRITVALAGSEYHRAVAVLEAVLNSPLIPVRATPDDIRTALDKVWENADNGTLPGRQILAWSETAETSEQVDKAAQMFAAALGSTPTQLGSATLETALELMEKIRYDLIVTTAPPLEQLKPLLTPTTPSLLLLYNELRPIDKALMVVRGHAPDHTAMDWLIALAQHLSLTVTLLAGGDVGHTRLGFSELLNPESSFGSHLAECRQALTEAKISGHLKIRQASLKDNVLTEINEQPYELIVMAVEAYGIIAQDLLRHLTEHASDRLCAVLLVKPSLP